MSTVIFNIGKLQLKQPYIQLRSSSYLFEILIHSVLQKLLLFYHYQGQGSRFWTHSNVAYHLKSFKKFLWGLKVRESTKILKDSMNTKNLLYLVFSFFFFKSVHLKDRDQKELQIFLPEILPEPGQSRDNSPCFPCHYFLLTSHLWEKGTGGA